MILQLIFSGLRKNGRNGIFIRSQKFQSFFRCHFYILQEAEWKKKDVIGRHILAQKSPFLRHCPPFFGHETHEKGTSKISAQPLFPHFFCLAVSPKMGVNLTKGTTKRRQKLNHKDSVLWHFFVQNRQKCIFCILHFRGRLRGNEK